MNIEEIVAEGVNKFNNKYKEFSKKNAKEFLLIWSKIKLILTMMIL